MQPIGIEFVDESIEAGPLLQAVHVRRPDCVLFEGVLTFMPADVAGYPT